MKIELLPLEAEMITSAIRSRITQCEAIVADTKLASVVREVYAGQAEWLGKLANRIDIERAKESLDIKVSPKRA